MRRLVLLGIIVGLFATASTTTARSTAPPTSVGSGGVAASVDQLATEAAIDALRRGGGPGIESGVRATGRPHAGSPWALPSRSAFDRPPPDPA
jgi:hypothetical protein